MKKDKTEEGHIIYDPKTREPRMVIGDLTGELFDRVKHRKMFNEIYEKWERRLKND